MAKITNYLGENMDLREALYIINIYKHNGISSAAKELNISQSSLSRCLQSIEQSLGEPLFLRANSNYVPTFVGSQYLDYAEQLLDVEEQWNRERSKLINKEYSNITISTTNEYSVTIISRIIAEYQKRYPHVAINIIDINDNSTVNIDLKIHSPSNCDDIDNYEILTDDEIILIAPKGHKIKRESFYCDNCSLPCIEVEQILNNNFIMLNDTNITGKYVEDFFEHKHISPPTSYIVSNYETALNMTLNKVGLTFIPKSYAMYYNDTSNFDLYHFHKSSKATPIVASYNHKREDLPEYLAYLLELIRNIYSH